MFIMLILAPHPHPPHSHTPHPPHTHTLTHSHPTPYTPHPTPNTLPHTHTHTPHLTPHTSHLTPHTPTISHLTILKQGSVLTLTGNHIITHLFCFFTQYPTVKYNLTAKQLGPSQVLGQSMF